MSDRPHVHDDPIDASEQALVLSLLEPGQLADTKRQRLPRRRLSRGELVIVTALRVYLLFMVAVVVYEVWTGTRS